MILENTRKRKICKNGFYIWAMIIVIIFIITLLRNFKDISIKK